MKTKIEYLILVFLCFASFTLIAFTGYYSNHGFDLTDEGFYINSIIFPHLYSENFTLFGFFYHPFFLLFKKNWIILRQVNLIAIFGLTWLLSFLCIKFFSGQNRTKKSYAIVLSLSMALFASTYLSTFNWLISPSYNSLNFIGLLIITIGIVLKTPSKLSAQLQMMVIAFGFFCVLMSKISSLLVLSLVFTSYCVLSRQFAIKQLFNIAFYFMVFALTTVYLIDASIFNFSHRILDGVNAYRSFITPSVWRLDLFPPEARDKNTLLVLTLLLTICFGYFGIKNTEKKKMLLLVLALILGYRCIVLIKHADFKNAFQFREIDLFYLPIIACLNVIFIGIINRQNLLKKNTMLFGLFLFVLPYVYSFGTSNPYWYHAQMTGFFWVLSAFCCSSLLISDKNSMLLVFSPILLFGLFLLAVCDYRALSGPYRQPNIIQHQQTPMQMPNQAKVFVANELNQCVSQLRAQINQHISKKPFNLIDFTGFAAGLIYLLDANPIGSPWFLLDYPNSNQYFYRILSPIIKNHRQSYYLLFAADEKKIKQMPILKMLHINIARDYSEIAVQKCALQAYGLAEIDLHLYQAN